LRRRTPAFWTGKIRKTGKRGGKELKGKTKGCKRSPSNNKKRGWRYTRTRIRAPDGVGHPRKGKGQRKRGDILFLVKLKHEGRRGGGKRYVAGFRKVAVQKRSLRKQGEKEENVYSIVLS